jgi:hypothetical protein
MFVLPVLLRARIASKREHVKLFSSFLRTREWFLVALLQLKDSGEVIRGQSAYRVNCRAPQTGQTGGNLDYVSWLIPLASVWHRSQIRTVSFN